METIDFNTVITENISVVEGLLPVVSELKNGLMDKDNFYYRGTISLTSPDTILDKIKSNLKMGIYSVSGYRSEETYTDWGTLYINNNAGMYITRNFRKVIFFVRTGSEWYYGEVSPAAWSSIS